MLEIKGNVYLLLQGNMCPENTTKYKPRSCVDHLRNGANRCGYYEIYDAAGNRFTVYCDMETEPGAAWTLVVSWSFKYKDFSSRLGKFSFSQISFADMSNALSFQHCY